jgi:hypothetical protein
MLDKFACLLSIFQFPLSIALVGVISKKSSKSKVLFTTTQTQKKLHRLAFRSNFRTWKLFFSLEWSSLQHLDSDANHDVWQRINEPLEEYKLE